ncbi:MAG: hypothetical protein EBR82_14900 [Caulobacteraceae bacterium]|nr:hypothetical protein [Caulobacteraceae bacterium]
MPISSNVTAVEQVLKLLYKKGVPNLSYNKQALLSKIPVVSDFTGEKKVLALQTTNPQGFGADFTRAYAHRDSAESYRRFELFRVQHYGFAQVAGEVMRTAVDPGSLVNVWRNRTESVVRGMQNSAGRLIYGSGTGRIGAVSALGTTSTTVTLSNSADVANFEAGMYITMYTSESFAAQYVDFSGGAPTNTFSSTNMVRKIDAVNRDLATGAATLTLDTAATWPAGAIIVRDGDGIVPNGTATSYDTNARSPAGIKQWISGSLIGQQPFGNTLFGLDRSSDKVRLGGSVVNAAGKNMVEALQDLESNILFQGMGYPTAIAANTLDIATLKKSALSDVIRIPAQDPKQNLNYQSVVFLGQNGAIPFIEDPFCPRGEAYMLNLPSWSISTAPGGMFQLVDWDGVNFLRLMDSDDYQARFASYYQIGCDNPGSNGYLYGWGA